MAGKGRKRREKNYRAAHGGYSTLPPPPKTSQLDRLPSKLRQIMSFTQHPNGPAGVSKDKKRDDGHDDQDNIAITSNVDVEIAQVKQRDTGDQLEAPQDSDEQLNVNSGDDKKKKKRKRKEVKDLRFAMEEDKTSSQLKKRERKKKYLEKKKKHKKGHEEENFDFPGQEKIKFGDIVKAPPKFSVTPKAFKNAAHDASHERLRLRAIEEYRSRKAWTSRPGSHRPPPVDT